MRTAAVMEPTLSLRTCQTQSPVALSAGISQFMYGLCTPALNSSTQTSSVATQRVPDWSDIYNIYARQSAKASAELKRKVGRRHLQSGVAGARSGGTRLVTPVNIMVVASRAISIREIITGILRAWEPAEGFLARQEIPDARARARIPQSRAQLDFGSTPPEPGSAEESSLSLGVRSERRFASISFESSRPCKRLHGHATSNY